MIVADTSPSMRTRLATLVPHLSQWAHGLLSSGIDTRVVLIAEEHNCSDPFWNCTKLIPFDGVCFPLPLGSGQCPEDSNPPLFVHVNKKLENEDVLVGVMESSAAWQKNLRSGVRKWVITLSDNDPVKAPYSPTSFPDGESGASQQFLEDFTKLDPGLASAIFSGVYAFSSCSGEGIVEGKTWAKIVQKTGGIALNLCVQDDQPFFDALSQKITTASAVSCRWQFPDLTPGQPFGLDDVRLLYSAGVGDKKEPPHVAGIENCGPDGGWFYDDPKAPSVVVACPATCADLGSNTQIFFSLACDAG